MSLTIERSTKSDMIRSFSAFLPGGELFESAQIPGTNLHSLIAGLSGELLRAENFLFLYNSEFLPDNTTVFIEEWESTLGIPDDCFPGPAESDISVRRLHILVKLASLGVQTANDFVNLAVILGFPGTEVLPGIGGEPDSVINGDFSLGTDWNLGVGWSISSGTANHIAGTASDIDQDINSVIGEIHVLKYDVLNRTAGTITPLIGLTAGVTRAINGSFEEQIIGGAGDTDIRFTADATFDGSIDNVIVRPSIDPPDGRFTIVINFKLPPELLFPLDFPIPFGSQQFAILECLFTKLKPANCQILFGFI